MSFINIIIYQLYTAPIYVCKTRHHHQYDGQISILMLAHENVPERKLQGQANDPYHFLLSVCFIIVFIIQKIMWFSLILLHDTPVCTSAGGT